MLVEKIIPHEPRFNRIGCRVWNLRSNLDYLNVTPLMSADLPKNRWVTYDDINEYPPFNLPGKNILLKDKDGVRKKILVRAHRVYEYTARIKLNDGCITRTLEAFFGELPFPFISESVFQRSLQFGEEMKLRAGLQKLTGLRANLKSELISEAKKGASFGIVGTSIFDILSAIQFNRALTEQGISPYERVFYYHTGGYLL
ncbi:MAG: hypothetical protein Q8P65_01620 [bacterium]|nr:hypothetical protein [bacterium]